LQWILIVSFGGLLSSSVAGKSIASPATGKWLRAVDCEDYRVDKGKNVLIIPPPKASWSIIDL